MVLNLMSNLLQIFIGSKGKGDTMADTSDMLLDIIEKQEVTEYTLFQGLKVLFDMQNTVSGIRPESLDGSMATITQYLYALSEEIHELGRELPWKPWRTNHKAIDEQYVIKEFSDLLAFIGILMINIGKVVYNDPEILPRKLAEQYLKTSIDNIYRLTNS